MQLPTKDKFYNEYKQTQLITCDILLLADVFENLRKTYDIL